jgi:hypothetical protein
MLSDFDLADRLTVVGKGFVTLLRGFALPWLFKIGWAT